MGALEPLADVVVPRDVILLDRWANRDGEAGGEASSHQDDIRSGVVRDTASHTRRMACNFSIASETARRHSGRRNVYSPAALTQHNQLNLGMDVVLPFSDVEVTKAQTVRKRKRPSSPHDLFGL